MTALAGDRHLLANRGAGGEGKSTATLRAATVQGDQGESLPQLSKPQDSPDGQGSYGPRRMGGDHAHNRGRRQTTGEESSSPDPPPCSAPGKDTQLSGCGREAEERDGSGKGHRCNYSWMAFLKLVHAGDKSLPVG